MVFEGKIPSTYEGYEVLLGDDSDERLLELEGTGKIIGLKYKKPRGKEVSLQNFVVRV